MQQNKLSSYLYSMSTTDRAALMVCRQNVPAAKVYDLQT